MAAIRYIDEATLVSDPSLHLRFTLGGLVSNTTEMLYVIEG
jgi:hypothetical protein